MSSLAAALPRTSTLDSSPAPLRASIAQSESPRPSPGRKRRSSSRVNLLPHNVRDEEPPQDRFHEPTFQQAFCNAKALMGSLVEALGSSTLHFEPDSTIRNLRQTAQDLATIQCSPTRVVGLVGDSGVGTRLRFGNTPHGRLQLTILRQEQFAEFVAGRAWTGPRCEFSRRFSDPQSLTWTQSNSGAACTCVVTEYRYYEADNFTINVEEFSNDELRHQFTEMVGNYHHHHFQSAQIENDEDRRHWEDLAKLAHDTFGAMFRGRFNTELLTSRQQNEVVETLLGWARERNPVAGRSIVNTPEDCSMRLMHLTSEEASPQGPAAWPYIKKIRYVLA